MDKFATPEPLSVVFKRIDPELPPPAYATDGSAGFDLCARVTVRIEPGKLALIPLNVVVATPPGHMLMLAARSSLPRRKGLLVPNGVGIIDRDYCGPDDEIKLLALNWGGAEVTVERGERVAQGVFVKIGAAWFHEMPELIDGNETRGGFGSTG